jgi:hypothetical protein
MRSGKPSCIVPAAALAASLALCAAAVASPLTTAEASASAGPPAWSTLSAEQLVRTDAALDAAPEPLALGGGLGAEALRARSAAFGLTGALDAIGDQGAASLREQLRNFLNVERGSAGPGHPGNRPPQRSAELAGIDPGYAGIDPGTVTDEWIRDTVQALVHSTVRLETNARGRTAFSVLGVGEFSVNVSGDRSAMTLAEGDNVLFVAQRPQPWGGALPGARYPGPGGAAELGYLADDPAPLEPPPLKQVLELAADMATHPVSLLVYCIIAAYLLLWSVLSHEKRKRRGRARAALLVPSAGAETPAAPVRSKRRRRFRRRAPDAGLQRAAEPVAEAAAPVKVRKRVRMRIRVRIRKTAPSGRA